MSKKIRGRERKGREVKKERRGKGRGGDKTGDGMAETGKWR